MMTDKTDPAELAMAAVRAERSYQVRVHGQQNHEPEVWLAILLEEVGEIATAVLTKRFSRSAHRRAHSTRSEVTQVAAVALAWLESLIREEET